jgi:hypothetical protein
MSSLEGWSGALAASLEAAQGTHDAVGTHVDLSADRPEGQPLLAQLDDQFVGLGRVQVGVRVVAHRKSSIIPAFSGVLAVFRLFIGKSHNRPLTHVKLVSGGGGDRHEVSHKR